MALPTESTLYLESWTYDGNGNENYQYYQFGLVSGMMAGHGTRVLSQLYAVDPSTETIYARIGYQEHWMTGIGCPDECLAPTFPPDPEWVKYTKAYVSINVTNGSITKLKEWYRQDPYSLNWMPVWTATGDRSDPYYWGPSSLEVDPTGLTAWEANMMALHSRSDPISIVEAMDENDPVDGRAGWFLLHWKTQSASADDTFYPVDTVGTANSLGATYDTHSSGQQPETGTILDDTYQTTGWNLRFFNSGGSQIASQPYLGNWYSDPGGITGMFGRWAVQHYMGRWRVFGPYDIPIEPTTTTFGRWYVI